MDNPSSILITGCSGYIGKNLLNFLESEKVLGLDKRLIDSLDEHYQFINCDLCDISDRDGYKLSEFKGSIVNLAAARTDDAEVINYLNDNVVATSKLLQKLTPKNIKSFIHIGSVAAIDGENLAQFPKEISGSDDWYRYTKFIQQELIKDWCVKHKIALIILAPSAVYDDYAAQNNTNIGRLSKYAKILPFFPDIDVFKSLTPMQLIIDAILWALEQHDESELPKLLLRKYIVVERPTLTVSELVSTRYGIKRIIAVPALEYVLLFAAKMFNIMGLNKYTGLTAGRVRKLFADTAYINQEGYEEWTKVKKLT